MPLDLVTFSPAEDRVAGQLCSIVANDGGGLSAPGGNAGPGVSSGTAMPAMEELAAKHLPDGIGYEWTDLSYEQKQPGNTAQYESWSQPVSVILIVPMCLLAAVSGLLFRGMSIDILAQIGFVVLVALASKNAILIVEFAKQAEDAGETVRDAAVQAVSTAE